MAGGMDKQSSKVYLLFLSHAIESLPNINLPKRVRKNRQKLCDTEVLSEMQKGSNCHLSGDFEFPCGQKTFL